MRTRRPHCVSSQLFPTAIYETHRAEGGPGYIQWLYMTPGLYRRRLIYVRAFGPLTVCILSIAISNIWNLKAAPHLIRVIGTVPKGLPGETISWWFPSKRLPPSWFSIGWHSHAGVDGPDSDCTHLLRQRTLTAVILILWWILDCLAAGDQLQRPYIVHPVSLFLCVSSVV